jgi:biotin carboxyl carrier protein
MSDGALVPPGSRAVLVAASAYEDPGLVDHVSIANSAEAMVGILTDPGLGGWPPEAVTMLRDPVGDGQTIRKLRQIASVTTGVLLLYYVGHGLVSDQGELCLAVHDTDHEHPDVTGMEYTKIRDLVHRSAAATKIVILDSCFSGRAIGLSSADPGIQLADLSAVSGAYTLTAADEIADAGGPDPTARTAFTGTLVDLVRTGIPGGPPGITLGRLYTALAHRLASKGLPRPNQRSDEMVAEFVFTRNAAPSAGPARPAAVSAPSSATERYRDRWLADTSQRLVEHIEAPNHRAVAAALIGSMLVGSDPARSQTLIAHAERTALDLTRPRERSATLAGVAGIVAASDIDRCRRLLDHAEKAAAVIASPAERSLAISEVASARHALDRDQSQAADGAEVRSQPPVVSRASEFGPNEWLVDELYQQFLADPESVDRAWWDFFADYAPADARDDRILVILPSAAARVSGGALTRWLKHVGEHVEPGDPVALVAGNGVEVQLLAPAAGTLCSVLTDAAQPVLVGDVLAVIDVDYSCSTTHPPTSQLVTVRGRMEVSVPAMGEAITEVTVYRWLKNIGDPVSVDEALLEISTDKVDTEVPSPFTGTLVSIAAREGETIAVGAALAVIQVLG